ncbi:MAG: divalent metal cation transporter [Pirellulales bacterium]|nr:divalent metal cation transporter [Pirellulales bacterium]|tara:strand:+ start:1878 stop:3566 length:1689 start_codon:yes stop_codon:yes gene_type:complete
MSTEKKIDDRLLTERSQLEEAQAAGVGRTLATYTRLSGPGWLQSAITLGGGSLAGSLYLGVIGGYEFLWLQPLMMMLGIVMLSAIAYVTLSTGKRPFQAMNEHVSPVLGWGWLLAAMMANLVWAMPQFSLGTAALQQNLFPQYLAGDSAKNICVLCLFLLAAAVVWFYDSPGWGVKIFELSLKAMVGLVVLSFFGVVVAMSWKGELDWISIAKGFVPDFSLLWRPVTGLHSFIDESSDPEFWTATILRAQRERMIAAAATAVGINMTFLLPYSMLRKGWDRAFRGLAAFDLSTGLFIPFLVATSCVVIAAASQFHARFDEKFINQPAADIIGSYRDNLEKRIQSDSLYKTRSTPLSHSEMNAKIDALPSADRKLAYMLIKRDSLDLATALENLFGKGGLTQKVFGIGVLGMAISTIVILMVINGFCVSEMTGRDGDRVVQRLGALFPGVVGGLGFLALWGDDQARFWLAVPTSNFGMVLLPIAYIAFFFMMNSPSLLGDAMPKGMLRIVVNAVMLAAIIAASIGAGLSVWANVGWIGVAFAAGFVVISVVNASSKQLASKKY